MDSKVAGTDHFNAPVWLVGFRPFFIATIITGALLPMIWVLTYNGLLATPSILFNPFISSLHWHMHEMFFGFGWALLGGFLLTASKNWLGIRGHHGATLAVLVILWCADRIAMAFGGDWPIPIVYTLSFPFLVAIVALLEIDLVLGHGADSYKDNVYFIIALPLFIIAKAALLNGGIDPIIGKSMTLGLFRLCFLIMLERTLEAFMRAAFGVQIKRIRFVDHAIKGMALVLVFSCVMIPALQTILAIALATLLLIRWIYWYPTKALQRIDIGVMYLGYLAIIINLVLQGTSSMFGHWSNSFGVHVFTLGTIGLIAPAMIIRISNGHTGRKVTFSTSDKFAIYMMIIGLFFRVGAPFFAPLLYTTWLYTSATCWFFAFTTIGYKYIPILLAPRLDGRSH
jgi:uncharacterized protein involved in response to NO